VAGGGSIGERHIRNAKRINGVGVSVCEPRRERATELKERYDLDRIVPDYDQADLGGFDAVLIATPVRSHIDYATKAVNCGCHVLIEKPLSHSLDGIDELDALAKEKDKVVGVALVQKNHPMITRTKKLIDAGELGKICLARFFTAQYLPYYRPDYKDTYFVKKEMGGGVILDWMPHTINLVCHLLGEVSEILCLKKCFVLESECEDTAVMLLKMKSGAIVQVSTNGFQKNREAEAHIMGEHGTAKYSFETCRVSQFTGETQSWQFFDHHLNYGEDLFEAQVRNFVNAIEGKEEIRTGLPEAKYTMQVVFKAAESAGQQQFVKV
jgi:predicted dehydrogenase